MESNYIYIYYDSKGHKFFTPSYDLAVGRARYYGTENKVYEFEVK